MKRIQSSLGLGIALGLLLPTLAMADLFDRDRTEKGSGNVVSEVRELPSFDQIELDGSCDLIITVGDEVRVVVSGDDNLIERVRTEVEGRGTLRIDTRGSYSTRRGLRVEISMPHLTRLDITGSGDADIKGLREENLELNITGSGDVSIVGTAARIEIDVRGSGDITATEVEAEEVRIRSHGSGDIDLEGHADLLDVVVRGSGEINARRLATRESTAEIYGSGDVSVRTDESFDGAVYGSGDIDVYGNPPRVNRRVSGSGDITRH